MQDTIWYPHYIADYQRDTAHLSLLEHGAYRLLIDYYYSQDGKITADIDRLFKVVRATTNEEKDAVEFIVREYFTPDHSKRYLRHKRCEEELKKRKEISEKRAQAAKNKKKKPESKTRAKQQQKPTQSQSQSQSQHLLEENGFDTFWGLFPNQRKGNKQKAQAAYIKALQRDSAINILEGVKNYAVSREVKDGFAKGCAAWLNDDRWRNDYAREVGANNGTTNAGSKRERALAAIANATE